MTDLSPNERKVADHFIDRGHSDAVASAIATNFTQFMLDHVTAEGAAQYIHAAGARRATARDVVALFQDVKAKTLARRLVLTPS